MIRGYVIYSPKKNKGNRAKRKISKIKGKTEELTYTIQARFCPHVAADQTKLLEESVTTSAYLPPQRKLFSETQVGRIVCDLIYTWQE